MNKLKLIERQLNRTESEMHGMMSLMCKEIQEVCDIEISIDSFARDGFGVMPVDENIVGGSGLPVSTVIDIIIKNGKITKEDFINNSYL